jgi:3-methyladenine DNA glycosylase/8-oxoguanine DNA glycosylase
MPIHQFRLTVPLDLRLTLGPLVRGPADPAMRLASRNAWRATRTADGPAALSIEVVDRGVRAEAWGPGADRVLADLPSLLGLDDDPSLLRPAHALVDRLARRMPGLRIGRTGAVTEVLVPAILEQKVTGTEAFRAYRGLLRRYGEPAPGPLPLVVPPPPDLLAALPYHAFHPFGVEARRAETIRRATSLATRLEEAVPLGSAEVDRRLRTIVGIGPWTSAEVRLRALGDPDAVSIGDFHLPHLVAWTLAREPRADDTRMLELLEPYRGQRARVVRLLEASGLAAPRFGARMAPRSIAHL